MNPASSNFNGQTIIVEGPIVVDTKYTMGVNLVGGDQYNQIWMEPNTWIEIEEEKELNMFYATIKGCGGNWDKILINSNSTLRIEDTRIEDAAVAIEFQDNSSFFGWAFDLQNNDIGMGAFGNQMKTVNIDIAWSIFGHLSRIANCREGVHFENVEALNLLGGLRFF